MANQHGGDAMTVWDDIAADIGPDRAAWDDDRADQTWRHANTIANRLNTDIDGPIVEFGCGPGRLTLPIAKRLDRHIIAIDTSPAMVAPLTERVIETNAPVTVMLTDLTDPDHALPANSVSNAYTMLTFQHMTDDDASTVVETIAQSLRPAGRFIAQFVVGNHNDVGPLSHPRQPDMVVAEFEPLFRHVRAWADPVEPTWFWIGAIGKTTS